MKKLISLLLALVMICGLVACGNTAAPAATKAPAAEAPAAEAPAAEAPAQENKVVKLGLANINEKATFGKLVKMGFENACAAKGWELVYVDNNSDGAQAVQNAEILVQNDVDFIVNLNVDQSVAGTIVDIVGEAGIPMLAVDIALGDTPFFGCDSGAIGDLTGEYATKWIKDNWDGELDYIVCFTAIASGDEVQKRARNAVEAVKNSDITVGEVVEIECQNDTAVGQQRFADFLTAHPDAKKIACFTINENPATGAMAAGETAGRTDDFRIFSCGVGSQFVDPMYEAEGNTSWVSSIAVFPELYGEQICQIVEDYFNGTELAAFTPCKIASIDWNNISEYYPKDDLPWNKIG